MLEKKFQKDQRISKATTPQQEERSTTFVLTGASGNHLFFRDVFSLEEFCFVSNAQTNASVVFTNSEPFILNQNGEKSRFKSDSSSESIFTAFVVS